jgi:hypothetical protein
VSLSVLLSMAFATLDKYTLKALKGVAFSEFRGYGSELIRRHYGNHTIRSSTDEGGAGSQAGC